MAQNKSKQPVQPITKRAPVVEHIRERQQDRVQGNVVSPRDPILKVPQPPPRKK